MKYYLASRPLAPQLFYVPSWKEQLNVLVRPQDNSLFYSSFTIKQKLEMLYLGFVIC